jgi:hypothetical protein
VRVLVKTTAPALPSPPPVLLPRGRRASSLPLRPSRLVLPVWLLAFKECRMGFFCF